jgi:peptidoglycan/LPS O-acetylase OafA/YrhL
MLINIQFLRFAAAMLVVVYHASSHLRATGVDQGLFFAVSEAVGFAGVDIFFVISGFIMAFTTQTASGVESGVSFAKRRVARIYSGYWPFYILAIVLFAWTGSGRLAESDLWRSAILWPANNLLIGVSWTLIFEMYFYLLFTLLIFVGGGQRDRILKILLAFIVLWSLYSQFLRHAYDPGQLETISLAEYYMLSPYMAEFIVGSLLAGWLTRHPHGPGWTWLIAGCLLFLAGGWINNSFFDGKIEQGYYVFYRVLAFGPASLLMLAGLVWLERGKKVAPLRFSLLAGGASYAIYLSHTLLLATTQHLGLNKFLSHYQPWLVQSVFLFYSIVILAYSMMHYRVIEAPLHRLFKRWLGLGPK